MNAVVSLTKRLVTWDNKGEAAQVVEHPAASDPPSAITRKEGWLMVANPNDENDTSVSAEDQHELCSAPHPTYFRWCTRGRGHDGQHGYAGMFWDAPGPAPRVLPDPEVTRYLNECVALGAAAAELLRFRSEGGRR